MVRFAAADFDRVARSAAKANMTLADFVREAVLERVAPRAVR